MIDGIDTIRNLSTADCAHLRSVGVKYVSRYIARSSRIHKIMGKAEYDLIIASGLGLVVNFEESGTSWRRGYVGGQSDGEFSRRYCDQVLHHVGAVYFSIDEGVAQNEYGTAREYARGVRDTMGSIQGFYGPGNVVSYLVTQGMAKYAWQWKDGTRPNQPHVNVRQRYADTKAEGAWDLAYSYDSNESLTADFGQVTKLTPPVPPKPPTPPDPTPVPPVPPTPTNQTKARDMLIITVSDVAGQFRFVYNGTIVSIDGNAYNYWKSQGVPYISYTNAQVLKFCADFNITSP